MKCEVNSMRKKIIFLPIIGVLILSICLVGCKQNTTPIEPDITNPSVTNPIDTPTIPDETTTDDNSIINETLAVPGVISDSQVMWDKPYQQMRPNDIYFDENWDLYITVGERQIATDVFTDISILNNYFYDDVVANADAMKMAYELNWRDFYAVTETFANNSLANGEVKIFASTYPSENLVFDVYNRNLVITSVRYNSFVSNVEEVVNALNEMHVEKTGAWGIGSVYEDVVTMIGNPEYEATEAMYENCFLTTSAYRTDKCTLSITYFSTVENSKGIVVGFVWTPNLLSDEIVRQEGYDGFSEGLYSDITLDMAVNESIEENNTTETNDAAGTN